MNNYEIIGDGEGIHWPEISEKKYCPPERRLFTTSIKAKNYLTAEIAKDAEKTFFKKNTDLKIPSGSYSGNKFDRLLNIFGEFYLSNGHFTVDPSFCTFLNYTQPHTKLQFYLWPTTGKNAYSSIYL